MTRHFTILLMLGLLSLAPAPASAQNANVAEAKRLADSLSSQNELPVNVRLRFQLLRDMMGGLAGKGDPANALRFFSTTRVLFWNRPVNPGVGQTMRDYEAQVVALARGKGVGLDLPPVGYSTAGAAGGASPLPASASSAPLLGNRETREALAQIVLRAEETGTNALGSNGRSPQLLALRDSLTVLRQDLVDASVSSDAVRNVLLNRAIYLSSPAAGANAELLQKLDLAADALRGAFPPETLRQAKGQPLRI